MDEYMTTWSDAARTEAAFLALEVGAEHAPVDREYGTLGAALWSHRCLSRLLAMEPDFEPGQAEAIVAMMSSDPSWLQVEPGEAAMKIYFSGDQQQLSRNDRHAPSRSSGLTILWVDQTWDEDEAPLCGAAQSCSPAQAGRL